MGEKWKMKTKVRNYICVLSTALEPYFLLFWLFKKYFFEDAEREKSTPIHWFTPQMPARAMPPKQEPTIPSNFLCD